MDRITTMIHDFPPITTNSNNQVSNSIAQTDMTPIILGFPKETSDVDQLSKTSGGLGLDEKPRDGRESATNFYSITSLHVSKDPRGRDLVAEALAKPISNVQLKRGMTTKLKNKNPYIPFLNTHANDIKGSEEDGSASSSEWKAQREENGSLVKRLGTDKRRVWSVMGAGEEFGVLRSCVGSVGSVYCVEDNEDEDGLIRPLPIEIAQNSVGGGTSVPDHDSPHPQYVLEPTDGSIGVTRPDFNHVPPTKFEKISSTPANTLRGPISGIKYSKSNIPSELSSHSKPPTRKSNSSQSYKAPKSPQNGEMPLLQSSLVVQAAKLKDLERDLLLLEKEQLRENTRIRRSQTSSLKGKEENVQSTENRVDAAASLASESEDVVFGMGHHNLLRDSIYSLQQGREVALSPDFFPEREKFALKHRGLLWESNYSPQQKAMSRNLFESSKNVVNGYGAETVLPVAPPLGTNFKPYPQNQDDQYSGLVDGSEIAGGLKGGGKPTSLNSGAIQQLADNRKNTSTPQRNPSYSLPKHSQTPMLSSLPYRPCMERQTIVQSQSVPTMTCSPPSLHSSQLRPSTHSKVSSLCPYSPKINLGENLLSSKDPGGKLCLVVPKTTVVGPENLVKFRNFMNFDLPPQQKPTPSAQHGSNATTFTGISKISHRDHRHLKLSLALARSEIKPPKPSKASESTLSFLRHHDHPNLRNTPKQRDTTSRACHEARIFTETSKAHDFILEARQKLERDRHQASINFLFSELDELDSLTMTHPISKSMFFYAGLLILIIGITGSAIAFDRFLTARHENLQLIGSELGFWASAAVMLAISGLLWIGLALCMYGNLACMRDRDPLGLREVSSQGRRDARLPSADIETGIELSSINVNRNTAVTLPVRRATI